MRPIPFLLPLVPLLAAALGGCGSSRTVAAAGTPPTGVSAVPVVKAARQSFNQSIVVTGELTPFQEVEVMSKVAGYVRHMHVDVGDVVRKGQILAELEVPEMADDLTRASASIQRSKADLQRFEEELRRSQTAHELAHLTYSRMSSVANKQPGLVAQQEIDDALTRDQMAEAQMAASRSALSAAQEQIKVAQAEKNKFITLMQYARVVAPFDGVVTQRYANDGAMIQAGVASQTQAMPVVRLSQNSLLRVVLPVPESAAGVVRMGSPVQVRVPSLQRTFAGKVARTSDRIDTSTRTMRTEVDVPNPDRALIPGMYAEISLVLAERPSSLAVPVTALTHAGDRKLVWLVDDSSRLQSRAVETGMETPDFVEVTAGLAEGDLVVSAARGRFRTGDRVEAKLESPSPRGGA